MPFLYSIIVGILLGFANLSLFKSILIISGLISFYSLKDIIFKRGFITGIPSPYQLYLENLDQLGKSRHIAGMKYYFKSLLGDGIVSVIVFVIIRVIF